MRLRADRRQRQAARQIVVAGADQPGEVLLQGGDDGLLHLLRETAAGAEIHQAKARHIDVGDIAAEGAQLLLKMVDRLLRAYQRRAVAMHHFADQRQQRHLP